MVNEQYNMEYSLLVIKPEGKLVYEYNPLFNYRLNKDTYLKDSEGNYLDENRNKLSDVVFPLLKDGSEAYGYIVTTDPDTGHEVTHYGDPKYKSKLVYEEDGMLLDLITGGTYIDENGEEKPEKDDLNFDLEHPVDILCLESYDGSINLILNDNKNIPRLINTRFTPLLNNTYRRIDRKGNTDTNIYDKDEFDIDASLFKRYNKVPIIEFVGVFNGGELKVGNYTFYFKLADADGNETDFFGESGMVSVYVGNVNDPISIRGGLLNENGYKSVRFDLTNIDTAYDYVIVYYTRNTGQDNVASTVTAHKILTRYRIQSEMCNIHILGTEPTVDTSLDEINREYFMAHTAKTQAICLNRLFLGNVTKALIDTTELQRISLNFLPYYLEIPAESLIGLVQYNYTDIRHNKNEYYNPENIYNYVGYWPEEIYRFGIVYVMNDNSLSPVFSIRGIGELPNINSILEESKNKKYKYLFQEYDDPESGVDDPIYTYHPKLDYDDFIINKGSMENAAGVVQFPKMHVNTKIHETALEVLHIDPKTLELYGNLPIYALLVRASAETIKELQKYNVKGYFFVRLKRIPIILAQAFTIPVDSKSGTPLIWNKAPGLTKSALKLADKCESEEELMNLYKHSENLELKDEYLFESFLTLKGSLGGDFHNRILKSNKPSKLAIYAICPEYELNQPYYNTLFTGGAFNVKAITELLTFCLNDRLFYTAWYNSMQPSKKDNISKVDIVAVPDSSLATRNDGFTFRTKAGNAEDIKYLNVEAKVLPKEDNFEHFKKAKKSWWDKTWRVLVSAVIIIAAAVISIVTYGAATPGAVGMGAAGLAILWTTAGLLILNSIAMQWEWYSMETGLWINIGLSIASLGSAALLNASVMGFLLVASTLLKLGTTTLTIMAAGMATSALTSALLAPGGMDGNRIDYGDDESDSWELNEAPRDPVNMYSETTDDFGLDEGDGKWYKNKVKVVRGAYGPLLGITKNKLLKPNQLINIYDAGSLKLTKEELFNIRIKDQSPYQAVTGRMPLNIAAASVDMMKNLAEANEVLTVSDSEYLDGLATRVFRGDCYISTFTHRINRNFQDPDAPNNDIIVDEDSWRDNWKEKEEAQSKVNRGDVNAVELGSWVTFKCYTSMNTALRDTDPTNPNEEALTGNKRTFYPYTDMCTDGNFKIPESALYCQGFNVSTSNKNYYILPEVPYLKDTYQTRIMYSKPAPTDAFQNGFREFELQAFRDYSNLYGGLMKLVSWKDNLIAVFEHAIGLIPVNEKVLLLATDTLIAVGAAKVIPDSIQIISDMYGSQWPESVLETQRYIYGVDTVAKKIWRTDGLQLDMISDLKVQKFLNEGITLTERELTPIIGVRNVKTHYNAFKGDVMFTFYDNTIGFEETAWNLCFNEILNVFVTLYSWVPSYSANIDNIFFSYDRNASKWITKLASSNSVSSTADGIVVRRFDSDEKETSSFGAININDWKKEGDQYYCYLGLANRFKPNNEVQEVSYTFELGRDNFRNDRYFEIVGDRLTITETKRELLKLAMVSAVPLIPVILLNITCTVNVVSKDRTNAFTLNSGWDKYFSYNAGRYSSLVFLTFQEVLDRKLYILNSCTFPKLRTDFWKHGQSGIIDIRERIKPCFWYGKQHPFEFEYVVGNSTAGYKQFTNTTLFTNKVFPESIHYTIIGDSYDFVEDKLNMYIRLEATKAFYLYNGADILYNHHTFDEDYGILPTYSYSKNYIEQATNGLYLRPKEAVSKIYKATIFPLLYARLDTFNEIEDFYKSYISPIGKDYPNLAGTEIIWDEDTNQFLLCNHVKVRDIKKVGRTRGNCLYVNDKMDIQITPIYLYNRNEIWTNGVPPILAYNLPLGIYKKSTGMDLPPELTSSDYILKQNDRQYLSSDVEFGDWEKLANGRKEIKLMDKYMKVRVRYPGDNLTLVMATSTIFNTMG